MPPPASRVWGLLGEIICVDDDTGELDRVILNY